MRSLSGVVVAAVLGLAGANMAEAAEISLVSGLYKNEKEKGGETKSEISAGGRFADQLDAKMFWFGQGLLTMRSYSGDGPSDSTSLNVGGGIRYYFNKLGENVSPFAYGLGEYRSNKDASQNGASYTETEENGLYYGAYFGIRLSLDTTFFVDFEAPLFDSALFGTEKSETTSTDPTTGTKSTSKSEKTKTEIFGSSTGALTSMRVALGMRL